MLNLNHNRDQNLNFNFNHNRDRDQNLLLSPPCVCLLAAAFRDESARWVS